MKYFLDLVVAFIVAMFLLLTGGLIFIALIFYSFKFIAFFITYFHIGTINAI